MKKKNILRILTIGILSVLGVIGLVVGIFAISGGFRGRIVPATSLYINSQSILSNGNIISGGELLDDDGNVREKHIIIEDDITVMLGAMPEEATNNSLTVTVKQDINNAISVPERVRTHQPFTIKVMKDDEGRNIGGSAIVEFFYESLFSCKLNIIVDTPISSPISSESVKYSVDLPSIKVPIGETQTDNDSVYVVARELNETTIQLTSDYHNAFKINNAGINFLKPEVERDVLFFTEQNNIITTNLGINENNRHVYNVTINLNNVEGSRFNIITRMHRTYQMQEEFKEKGFLDFFDFYYQVSNDLPISITDAQYADLVTEYNQFLNKYYDYINDTRAVEEFFTQFQRVGNEITLRTEKEKETFLSGVWQSLKYVFIVADIEFLISDVEITSLNVTANEHIFTVFDNKEYQLSHLIDLFGISVNLDGESTEIDEAAKLSLLTNLSMSVFVDDEEAELQGLTTTELLKAEYNLNNITNANGDIFDMDIENRLRQNNNYLQLVKTANTYNFRPKLPSKDVDDFQIYVMFALSITSADGTTKVFYDFSEVAIEYTGKAVYEGGNPSNLIERKANENPWDMCVDNNGLVSANPDIFANGEFSIGTQTIIIDTNKITNKQNMQSQYLIPRLFLEYNSNIISREEMQVYINGSIRTLEAQDFNVIQVDNHSLANFARITGEPITYGGEESLLTGYEIPLTNLQNGKFSANIQAINSSEQAVKFFVVFVLADENYNAIDREGNRLFNDDNQAVNLDGELIDEPVNYVVLYSTLSQDGDILANLKFSVISLLEEINYFTKVNMEITDSIISPYLYEEKTSDGEIIVKEAGTDSLFLRNDRTDGSIDLSFTKLRLLTNETYEKLIYISGYKITRRYSDSQTDYQLFIDLTTQEMQQIENGIDIIGNIHRAFESALNKTGEEKLDFFTESEDVVVVNNNEEVGVGATLVYDAITSPFQTMESPVLKVKSGHRTIYKLLTNDTLTISVQSPTINNITQVNDDEFDGIKNIIMEGEFNKSSEYGDITWQFFVDDKTGKERYSFYYGSGAYKTRLEIDAKDTNMKNLYSAYIAELEKAKTLIDFDEDLIANKTYEQDLAEIINIINSEIKNYNIANGTSYSNVKISFTDEENVMDASNSNNNYIETYLRNLISKANNIDFDEFEKQSSLVYNVDNILVIIQNYGIVPSTNLDRSDGELEYIISVIKNMYIQVFQTYEREFVSLLNESSINAVFDDSLDDEVKKDRVVSAINFILLKVPQYNANIVDVGALVDSIYTYDFDDVFEKVKYIAENIYHESLNVLAGDSKYKKLEELISFVDSKSIEKVLTINDVVRFINNNENVENVVLKQEVNIVKYFNAGTYNAQTKQVLLNDDGTLPFAIGNFGDFVVNVDFTVSFFQSQDGSKYNQEVKKRYAFYATFEEINAIVIKQDETSQPVTEHNHLVLEAGRSYNLSQFVYINDERYTFDRHLYISIPEPNRSQVNFGQVDGQNIYEVHGINQVQLYINSVISNDDFITLKIIMPYYKADGSALTADMYIRIRHNYEYTTVAPQYLISSEDSSEVQYDTSKLSENFTVKHWDGVRYSDIPVQYQLQLVSDANQYIRFENQKLYVKNTHKDLTVNFNVNVYLNDNFLFTFKDPVSITVKPFYKVDVNPNKVHDYYFEDEVLYNNSNLLESLFVFSKFNTETNDYQLITNIAEIRHILTLSLNIDESIPLEYWLNIDNPDNNIKSQFFTYDANGNLTYTNLYWLIKDSQQIDNNGNLQLPELAKTVMLPVVVNFNGYYDGLAVGDKYQIYIFIKVGGIIKWQSNNGEIDAEYNPQQDFSLDIENDYKQNFTPINLTVGNEEQVELNLREYFALLLTSDYSSEYKFLSLSFQLEGEEIDGINMLPWSDIDLENGEQAEVAFKLYIDGSKITQQTAITLKITAYEFVGEGLDIIYKQIQYTDNIVEIIIN